MATQPTVGHGEQVYFAADCPVCDGTGEVRVRLFDGWDEMACDRCEGDGFVADLTRPVETVETRTPDIDTVHLTFLASRHVPVTVVTTDGNYYPDATIDHVTDNYLTFTTSHGTAQPHRDTIVAVIAQPTIDRFVNADGTPAPTIHYGNGRTYVPHCTGRATRECRGDATHMVEPMSLCAPCATVEVAARAQERERLARWARDNASVLAAEARAEQAFEKAANR